MQSLCSLALFRIARALSCRSCLAGVTRKIYLPERRTAEMPWNEHMKGCQRLKHAYKKQKEESVYLECLLKSDLMSISDDEVFCP